MQNLSITSKYYSLSTTQSNKQNSELNELQIKVIMDTITKRRIHCAMESGLSLQPVNSLLLTTFFLIESIRSKVCGII